MLRLTSLMGYAESLNLNVTTIFAIKTAKDYVEWVCKISYPVQSKPIMRISKEISQKGIQCYVSSSTLPPNSAFKKWEN